MTYSILSFPFLRFLYSRPGSTGHPVQFPSMVLFLVTTKAHWMGTDASGRVPRSFPYVFHRGMAADDSSDEESGGGGGADSRPARDSPSKSIGLSHAPAQLASSECWGAPLPERYNMDPPEGQPMSKWLVRMTVESSVRCSKWSSNSWPPVWVFNSWPNVKGASRSEDPPSTATLLAERAAGNGRRAFRTMAASWLGRCT